MRTGSIARSMGGERGPSPRRRTLLTSEKSGAEAEPWAKQALRESCRCVAAATPTRFQARIGATAVHEGGAFASFAAWRALVPRQGESPADAKWPLSMEGALGRRSHCRSRDGGERGLGSSRPGGPTRRRGHRPPKTGARDVTGAPEVGRIGRAGKNTPYAVTASPERGGCGSPKRRKRVT
jgi:hypothetical protein